MEILNNDSNLKYVGNWETFLKDGRTIYSFSTKQGYSYTIPNGYAQSTAENLNIWSQGTIDYYYAHDRVLSLDEIKHNTEILLNLKKDQ